VRFKTRVWILRKRISQKERYCGVKYSMRFKWNLKLSIAGTFHGGDIASRSRQWLTPSQPRIAALSLEAHAVPTRSGTHSLAYELL
jgi:hypothetical protein